jgi:hypothetical protein
MGKQRHLKYAENYNQEYNEIDTQTEIYFGEQE